MNRIFHIDEQTQRVWIRIRKLMDEVPGHLWVSSPSFISSNMLYMVGHLLVTQYYHSIVAITGPDKELEKQIPIEDLRKRFSQRYSPFVNHAVNPASNSLVQYFEIINQASREALHRLSEYDLKTPPMPLPSTFKECSDKSESLLHTIRVLEKYNGEMILLKKILFRFENMNCQ